MAGGGGRKEKHHFTHGASKYMKMWGMFLTEYASLCTKGTHRLVYWQALGIWWLIPGGGLELTETHSAISPVR